LLSNPIAHVERRNPRIVPRIHGSASLDEQRDDVEETIDDGVVEQHPSGARPALFLQPVVTSALRSSKNLAASTLRPKRVAMRGVAPIRCRDTTFTSARRSRRKRIVSRWPK
jgi:hypothetical protein